MLHMLGLLLSGCTFLLPSGWLGHGRDACFFLELEPWLLLVFCP